MDLQESKVFWETLCSLQGKDIESESKLLFQSIKYPKYIYRYCPVNTKSLEALRTNKLYFSSANYYNDPFDTFLHIDVDALRKEFLSAFKIPESTSDVINGAKTLLRGAFQKIS